MYDYKLIEAYAAVIQEEGFEKASRKLNLTQSAISQRVKLLEEQFGQILLLRITPPQPTVFGKKILFLYNQVAHLEDDLHRSCQETDEHSYSSLPIGINADTLATWFFQAAKPFLQENKVVLDLLVDDQDETHRFLRDGKVLGCVSTRKSSIQGCRVFYLGDVEYSLFCSIAFKQKWFSEGLTREAVRRAPMITFNRKDRLNIKILTKILGNPPADFSTYYVPSSELFMDFIHNGIAYGAMPDQQSSSAVRQGLIYELTPDAREVVSLYWHCWNIESKLLQEFSLQLQQGFGKIAAERA